MPLADPAPLSAAELDEIERGLLNNWLGLATQPDQVRRLVAMARWGLVMEQAVEAAWASTHALLSDMEATDA